MHVFEAIATRRSIRGFLDRDVPRETVEDLLGIAARAPSGGNIQPWKVHVLETEALRRVSAAIHAARAAGPIEPDYVYYPAEWREPWVSRKRKVGWALYGLAGIQKGDRAAGEAFHARNFDFFGAPVGLLLTIDRDAGEGAWVDLGIFAGTLMLAARGLGLDTCPQAFFAEVGQPIRESLPLPPGEIVVCGVALGHADPAAALNGLVTEREPVAGFATFHD
jgi:nitroreductase